MRIPESIVKKITEEADIVAIIGENIKLEKKGNDYKGICPFHNDSNPSFSVSPSKRVYKCFSCGESGNAITFIQKYKNLSFPQAIKYVGERMGINVEYEDDENTKSFQKYYRIMKEAESYYEFYLKNSKEGLEALDYLKKRNINNEIIKRFGIGLASKDMDLLYKSLTEKENPELPIDLLNIGLIKVNDKGNYYDVFRNRIMFSITDTNGNIVGFSGRIYKKTNSNEPKYVNSSESDIFKKNSILYNFSYAINTIKQKNCLFIFEGFMDIIAAYRANVLNCTATMGTALTETHISMIKKVTNNIVLCFDGDNAGINATKKAIHMLTTSGLNVKVLLVPEGLDPDEYGEKYGLDALNNFLENGSISSAEYLYQIAKNDLNLNDPFSIESFKNEVFRFLKYFNSNSLNQFYMKKIADDLAIKSESVENDFNHNKIDVDFVRKDENKIVSRNTKYIKKKYISSEKALIYYAYNNKQNCNLIFDTLGIYEGVNNINRDILFKIFDFYKKNDTINDDFINLLEKSELDSLNEIISDINLDKLLPIEKYLEVLKTYKSEKITEKILEKFEKNEVNDDLLKKFIKAKRASIKIIKRNEE